VIELWRSTFLLSLALLIRRSIDAPMFEPGSEVFILVVKSVDKGHDSFQSGDATAAKQCLTMA
jgi:hypothetical protein